MLTTSDSYRLISQNLTRSLTTVAREPQVARESKHYLEKIGEIKSVDDFMKNDRVYRFAMKAFGLEDMAYAKAFVRKVLTEGVDDPKAFANTLSDVRFKELASVFDFAAKGEAATESEETRQATVDRYVRQSLEQRSGEDNEGVRLALYFARKAPALSSAMGLLADRALLQVAQTALGIAPETAFMDVDRLADMYAKRVNVEDFKDPKKLDAFVTRFTTMWELNNRTTPQSSLSLAPFVSSAPTIGISSDVLASLNTLKLGGY